MPPILPHALSSASLAIGTAFVNKLAHKKNNNQIMIKYLTLDQAPRPADTPAALAATIPQDDTTLAARIGARLNSVDNAYQQWIHDHIDPIFGSKRYQQMRVLSGGRAQELSPVQKQANHLLALAGVGLGAATIATVLAIPIALVSIPFGLITIIPSIRVAYHKAVNEHKFSIVHLSLIYLLGLYMGGFLFIGAGGLFLLAFGYKIGALTEATIRDGLINVFGQQPRYAWRVLDGIETEVPIEQVVVGDILVFDVGQMIPIDGVIVEGIASIDQHMLTGEAQPIEKGVGDPVLAATIVLGGRIYVRVEKAGAETTAAQIGEVINRIATYRPSFMEKAVTRADRSLVPMLVGSGLGFLIAGPVGGLAMLGCNFTLNMVGLIPLTTLNFLNESSHLGILVKEGDALEKLHTVDTFVFDKTGTLTIEQPHVVHIHTCNGLHPDEVLRLAAAAERRQGHPVAKAILAAAAERQLILPPIEDAHYEVGYGIKVHVSDSEIAGELHHGAEPMTSAVVPYAHLVSVGSWRFMQMEQIEVPDHLHSSIAASQEQGHSLVFVALDTVLIGVLELDATIRPEARQVVEALHRRGMKTYIISGDQEAPTRALAQAMGMDGYFANTLPENKADLVAQLKEQGSTVCYVGDGINDAIALKKADVSVSLRGATTAATDTAQVVLMDADLTQLLVLIELVEEMYKNLDLNSKIATALTVIGASSILFLNAGFVIVEGLYAASIAIGVGVASKPLVQRWGNKDQPSTDNKRLDLG